MYDLYEALALHVTERQRHAASQDCYTAVKSRSIFKAAFVGAIFLAGAFCAVALTPGPARAQATASAAVIGGDPTAMVKAVVDQATAVVRDTQTPSANRDKRLREIAEANFDFSDMARTTLGYHWRQLTPQQQAQFVPLFTS